MSEIVQTAIERANRAIKVIQSEVKQLKTTQEIVVGVYFRENYEPITDTYGYLIVYAWILSHASVHQRPKNVPGVGLVEPEVDELITPLSLITNNFPKDWRAEIGEGDYRNVVVLGKFPLSNDDLSVVKDFKGEDSPIALQKSDRALKIYILSYSRSTKV